MIKRLLALLLLALPLAAFATRIPSGTTDQYIYFVAVDSGDFTTRETGLTGFTVYRSRNGAAAAAMTTPTVNETDTTNMPGVYELLLNEDMTIDAGDDEQEMVFHITATGMAPVSRTITLFRPKITVGNTLDVTSTGAAGIDWANVENPTTTVGLSGTTVGTVTTNTDMRGTDNALLASSAPTNFGDLAITATTGQVTVGTNNDKTGYSLSQSFPANFADLSITATTGRVDVAAVAGTAQTANDNGADINAILTDTGTTLETHLTDIKGGTFSGATDSLEAIRDRGDAAWTTGGGGSDPALLQNTTIATLASQTSFTLTAGSTDDDAFTDRALAIVTDQSTSTQKAVGRVCDYTGSTRTVTLCEDPAVFTMAAGDTVDIVAAATFADVVYWMNAAVSTSLESSADIADAVWDEALSGHTTAGTAGDYLGVDVAAILVDTAEIGAAGAGLTAVPWNASWDAEVESEVDDALGGGTGTALTAIPWNASWDAEVQSEAADALVAYDGVVPADLPTNFGSMVISGSGAIDALVQGYLNTLVTETTAGRIAGNQSTFWDNSDAATTNTVDDVGAGAGGSFWSTAEQNEIRGRLGITGTTAAGGNTPTLALQSSVDALNDLDAAGIRSAVGLASANLDTQIGTLATSSALSTAQSDLDTLTGTDGATLATSQPNYAPATAAALTTHDGKLDTVDGIVDTILVDTADMQPKLGTPAGASISADIAALPTANEIWQVQCEDQGSGYSCQEAMSLLLAEAMGTCTYTTGTRTWVCSDPSGTETRFTLVYGTDLDGDRTSSTPAPMTP